MSMIFFTFRAQTGARNGAMILGRAGIQGTVGRTPGFLSTGGCGYGIRVSARDGRRAAAVLRAGGHPYERSYWLEGNRGREVAL